MTKAKVSGSAQGSREDAAEKWLRQNDPAYKINKRRWTAPTTDALSRTLSETNVTHPTLDGLTAVPPSDSGSYRRSTSPDSDDTE